MSLRGNRLLTSISSEEVPRGGRKWALGTDVCADRDILSAVRLSPMMVMLLAVVVVLRGWGRWGWMRVAIGSRLGSIRSAVVVMIGLQHHPSRLKVSLLALTVTIILNLPLDKPTPSLAHWSRVWY